MTAEDVGSMTIVSRGGDILAAAPFVDAIVNPVNCAGTMGKGLALEVKRAYYDNYLAYVGACAHGIVKPGRMFVFGRMSSVNPQFIINFPTKRHWRNRSRIEDIEAGLIDLVQEIRVRDIRSIAIPALGCGLGGLDWEVVKPKILLALRPVRNLRTILYEPGEALGDRE